MSMDYRQFEKLLQNFQVVRENTQEFLHGFLLEQGMRVLAQTKAITPVDSGDLRNHWEISGVIRQGDSLIVKISNPLEYASHVEDGHMQHKRFLPLAQLEQSSKKGQRLAREMKAKYGKNAKGIMLKHKWIPGVHMARISITRIQNELPRRYSAAFSKFLKGLE